jgi:phosphoribosylformylglycinamidine synthase subunit PurQ / glutaminase
MAQVKVLVLRTAGTNCDQETGYAFELAGASAQAVHVNELIAQPNMLADYQILALPGGFSYGDDISAGKILANQLVHHFRGQVREFIDADKLVLGICNGFQVLVKAGILPGLNYAADNGTAQQATITYNDSDKFEDRWVYLAAGTDKCVFINPGQRIYLPVAHGEGKVCFADDQLLEQARADGQVAFRYVTQDGQFGDYPANPNGSVDHIAGLCDPTGRVLGLMPHPERFVHRTHHPRWTRENITQADGLSIFVNAVKYFE